eukprot:TRINITY_DN3954_c0_g1_i1.p1 TRINITY_DN3954_c0_g1~~TRINITY_DN3954_c0_g1_i1.p1  ORF type:complete len:366 (-),score=54.64 TRINITY_DN3954_c0_g1_i1:949-2046(-)
MVPKKVARSSVNRMVLIIASGLCVVLLLSTWPTIHAVSATTTRVSSGLPSSLANDLKAEWLPSEDVTFVLQRDMDATFFFVEDDPKHGIDPVRSFLLRAETSIRSVFRHLLYRPGCEMREKTERWGNSCAAEDTKKEQIVIDVGCNRGWYSLMAAAYGHRVYAFDPQPHCRTLLSASILVNGFHELVTFTHAFVTDQTDETMAVRRRTGCMGGFPNNNHAGYADKFRKPLDRLAGANDTVTVRGVSLDEIFDAERHDVLLLKMDVEGFESHALGSGRRLLEEGAIRNIIMEFNIPMMSRQPEGVERMKERSLELVRQLMEEHAYKAKGSHKGSWKTQKEMTMGEWEQLFSRERDMFVTIDAWFYK